MPLDIVLLRPPKLVSTKTLLLKHYYRRQGNTRRCSYVKSLCCFRRSLCHFVCACLPRCILLPCDLSCAHPHRPMHSQFPVKLWCVSCIGEHAENKPPRILGEGKDQEWNNHRVAKSGRFANFVREPGFNLTLLPFQGKNLRTQEKTGFINLFVLDALL